MTRLVLALAVCSMLNACSGGGNAVNASTGGATPTSTYELLTSAIFTAGM